MTYNDMPTTQMEMNKVDLAFDYTNQAWVRFGAYVDCAHADSCICYGRKHKGEMISPNAELH